MPSRNRQRALARAKAERQIARRALALRRRRQIQAGLGVGLAVVLVVGGLVWSNGVFSSKPKKAATGTTSCAWTPQDASTNPNLKDVGTPPTTGIVNNGTETMTITTSLGTIEAQLDLSRAPCTAASFAYLAGKKFFDGSKCHRLTTEGIFVLQCGDPSGTGSGGPAYRFPDEYTPKAPSNAASASGSASPSAGASTGPSPADPPLYSKGVLAMANSGKNTNGSQFFIVYKDTPLPPNYTAFGVVTKGIDIAERVAAGGHDNAFAQNPDGSPGAGGGHPKTDVVFQSMTVGKTSNAAPKVAPSSQASPGVSAPG